MIHTIAQSLAQFLAVHRSKQNSISIDILVYGLECLLTDVVQIFLLVLTGLVTETLLLTSMFAVSFAFIKRTAGGYHANTHFACISMLTSLALIHSWLCRQIPVDSLLVISLICAAASCFLLIIFAPIVHPNHPKSESIQKKYRRICLKMAWLILPIVFFIGIITPKAAFSISCGVFSACAMLPFGLLKGGEQKWKTSKKN